MSKQHDLLSDAGLLVLAAQNAVRKWRDGDEKQTAAMRSLEEQVDVYFQRLKDYAETL